MDHDAATPTQAVAETSRSPLAIRSQRVLQVTLGLFWILDAALQFQPSMFGRGFVDTFILNNAAGQPFVLGDLITHVGNFVAPDIAVWNTFFALIQLFIGVGLLFRRTVRPALAVSFVWALAIWVIGEGMGMILTGTATALTGAPGSVLLYGLLGLMAWPRAPRRDVDWSDRPVGVASSAAAQGIGRSITPLAVWAGYWSLAAVLFVFPDNRTRTSVSSAIVGMAPGQPGWFSHFLTTWATSSRRPAPRRPGCWPPSRSSSASGRWWPAARGGSSSPARCSPPVVDRRAGADRQHLHPPVTDPNTGPLVVVLAAAMVPTVRARREWRPPAAELVRRSPAAAALGRGRARRRAGAERQLPAPAAESTGSAMAGMVMGGSGRRSGSASRRRRPTPASRTRSASRSPGSTWPTRPT